MADISNSKWTEVDVTNNAASPDGIQGGYAPSTVAPILRATRGALKRWYDQANAIYTSTGSASNYVVTFAQAPEEYVKGAVIRFFPNHGNTGAATININGLGVKNLYAYDGTALVAGAIVSGIAIAAMYDGAAFRMQDNSINPKFTGNATAATFTGNGAALTNLNASNIATGTIADARLPTSMSGKTLVGNTYINDIAGGSPTGQTIFQGFGMEMFWANGPYIDFKNAIGDDYDARIQLSGGNTLNFSSSANLLHNGSNIIWTSGNDGVGSTLDADLLDGQQGAYYLNATNFNAGTLADARLPATQAGKTFSSTLAFSSTTAIVSTAATGGTAIYGGTDGNGANIELYGGSHASAANQAFYDASIHNFRGQAGSGTPSFLIGGSTAWHAGNDGAGSGLDADVLDGQQGAYYLNASNFNAGTLPSARLTGSYAISVTGNAATATNATNAASAAALKSGGTGQNMTFNWSGQGGQPQWIWGGDAGSTGTQMYVYNPSNFSVAYAANAGAVGGTVVGNLAGVSKSSNADEVNFPLGHTVPVYCPGLYPARNQVSPLYLYSAHNRAYCNVGATQCAGSWRCRGILINEDWAMFERVA